MPDYVYQDDETGFQKEVTHLMSECDKPSETTLAEITHEGRVMRRVPQLTQIAGFSNLSPEAKKSMLKKRATAHHHRAGFEEKKRDMLKGL